MRLGHVMIDVQGVELSAEDREVLRHPAVGGVILFARNYQEPDQLRALVAAIRALREPAPLIAVDQEGGRVQRFRDGLTRLPPLARFGAWYRRDPKRAVQLTERAGWLMAMELQTLGVDFSFAPVVDLDVGWNAVIGDRSFGADREMVAELAWHWMHGVQSAGMAAVAKHFPGHGHVRADSHETLPVDERSFADIQCQDLFPFRRLIDNNLDAVMPAHVLYPQVDAQPAGFSRFWLRKVLRGDLGFEGLIFSDDLSMKGAAVGGAPADRAAAALDAGCDMALVCNDRPAALEVLHAMRHHNDPASHVRMVRMHHKPGMDARHLHSDPRWHEGVRWMAELLEPISGLLC